MNTAIAILGLAAFLGWMWYFGTVAGTALYHLLTTHHSPLTTHQNRP